MFDDLQNGREVQIKKEKEKGKLSYSNLTRVIIDREVTG